MTRVYDSIDPNYAKICSEVTIQSNPKGFFKSLASNIIELAAENGCLKGDFESCNSERERIQCFLNNKVLYSALCESLSYIQPVFRGKDGRVSRERRISAESALNDGKLNEALALANQAVIRAPMTGEMELVDGGLSLALALWVRSDILLRMSNYELATRDLQLALKERLPAKQRAEYYWRLGNCYKGTYDITRARVSYDLALRLIGADNQSKKRLEEDIQELNHLENKNSVKDKKTAISLSSGPKENMPALSRLVKIVEENNKGRYAVAASSIKTGDVLLIERPYAACLLPEHFGTHCCHCFQRLEAAIWCTNCSSLAFCSPKCRDQALATYHSIECKFIDIFIGSGMSILAHIALRMVTQCNLETLVNIHSKYIANGVKSVEGIDLNDIEGKTSKLKARKVKLNKNRKSGGNKKDGASDNNLVNEDLEDKRSSSEDIEIKASQIYSLCTHSEMRNAEDYLQRIIMSVFLLKCLQKTTFFDNSNMEEPEKVSDIVLELLLRNLNLLQFNAHELYETVRSPSHKFSGAKANYVGVGIYPTGALFNHECYPAVSRYFDGQRIILRAVRPLKPGDTIAENYGPQFLVKTKMERQRSLTCRYWFCCQCVTCMHDWPTLKQLPEDQNPRVRCSNKLCKEGINCTYKNEEYRWPSKCPSCLIEIDKSVVETNIAIAKKCVQEFKEAAQLIERERRDDAIAKLCPALDTFHEVATLPHKETHIAQESLRACFADSGNVHIVSVQQSIDPKN